MDYLRLPATFLLAALFTAAAYSQTLPLFDAESAYVPTASIGPSAAPTPSPYRLHKKLQQLFSGYAIEVAASNYPLERTDAIFRQFGNVYYDKLAEGGYSYVILANFDSDKSALHFLQTIIQPKVHEARLFYYKDGIRKTIRP